MTSSRVQPFCKKHNIILGCYDGFRMSPRSITKKYVALMFKNNICLVWKSQGVSFNKAKEVFKLNFKVVDNIISDKHDRIFIKFEYKP